MSKQTGFTLLELMITVALIGIVASIALPQYKSQVAKSKRSGAQSAVLELANMMEREKLNNGGYASLTNLPEAKDYTLFLEDVTNRQYKAVAKPTGGQAGDGALYVTHTGKRCWNKTDTDTASCDKTW